MRIKWAPGAWIAIAAFLAITTGCRARATQSAEAVTGGDRNRGRAAILKYGCGACHSITGIADARGLVGPPLTGVGNRMYIAGVLPNTPDNIVRWIQDPKAINEKTAMPKLGVSAQEATDAAAYLYSTK